MREASDFHIVFRNGDGITLGGICVAVAEGEHLVLSNGLDELVAVFRLDDVMAAWYVENVREAGGDMTSFFDSLAAMAESRERDSDDSL